jgi:hypothetical protein
VGPVLSNQSSSIRISQFACGAEAGHLPVCDDLSGALSRKTQLLGAVRVIGCRMD